GSRVRPASRKMFYAVLIVALVLLCVAAVSFYYALFLDGVARHQRRRIAELERENAELGRALESADSRPGSEEDEELWPEVFGEDDYRVR
ncbi:MAG TPA: hypothetical protein VGV38_18920, partial [Pyrinomonadaceae bacterium]|nr:hypothetical protein [Pyrinomonadaceae bacterium]